MKILIIDCSDSLYWYRNHIDQEFDVIKEFEESYKVRTPNGYTNFIQKEDAIEVDE
jgi:hypothetical protein